jgi:phage terminase large subunit-like protein
VADYRPETCAYCTAETWCEIRANGKPQCRACKIERFFSEILYPPLGYILMDWQRQVLRDLYGTVRAEDGKRRYRAGYVSVAKKNGKSFLIGGLPIYHLLMEGERNPEVYGAAAAKDQAGIVFRSSQRLIQANPDLQAKLRVLPSTKRIVRRDGGGFYAVLSADGDLQDGIEPSLAIRDEVHRWKSAHAETLRDVLVKGMISREEPIDLGITTAGAEYESQLWFNEYAYAKKVLDGSLRSEGFYAAIWEADAKRIESDPEYWKSREARLAANPSHEDLGGFLKDSVLVGELEKALAQPAERSKYQRYHLNVPIKAQEDPIIDMAQWQRCGGGLNLVDWPAYDVDAVVREWGLLHKPCCAGVDASWTTDLTAVVFVFPPTDGAIWTLLPFFWMPKERVAELERICRMPYTDWIRRGFIEAPPGNAIDLRAVKQRIHWGRETFELREVAFDRFNFSTQAMELQDEGVPAVEIPQSFLHLSHPTKFLLSAYADGKLRHGNHPVLNWMGACLQLQYDKKDNCQPSKPKRQKSAKRIDGISATVTALNRALVLKPQYRKSIFDDGPVVL